MAERNGTGVFPREIMNRFPLLPLEEARANALALDWSAHAPEAPAQPGRHEVLCDAERRRLAHQA